MADIVLYVGALGTVFLFLYAIYLFISGRDTALDRLQSSTTVTGGPTSIRKDDPENKILKMLKPFQDKIANDDDAKTNKRANLLQSAGFYNPSAQTYLYAIRLTLSIALASGCATFLLSTRFLDVGPGREIMIVTLFALIGYFFPLLYIKARIDERKLKFSEGLPDAMDMLLICLESGLSFPAAMKNVARELREVHPIVSEQFEIATLEFQAGRKRSEALRNLAVRVDLPEVTSITTMIIQSDALGTSLTRALRAAADDMRRDRMLRAEEKANALPAKLSVPLVLFIFPTLFCIIIVPVGVKIMRSF